MSIARNELVNLNLTTEAPLLCDVCRQLGIVNFLPLQPYFLEVARGTQSVLPGLPGTASLPLALDRGWDPDDPSKPPTAPALVSLTFFRALMSFSEGLDLGCDDAKRHAASPDRRTQNRVQAVCIHSLMMLGMCRSLLKLMCESVHALPAAWQSVLAAGAWIALSRPME